MSPYNLTINITDAEPSGSHLGSDKGINFPESQLHLPALTSIDLRDLEFVSKHADMVGLSFVNQAEDVLLLQKELSDRGASNIAVVLKIETKMGVQNLLKLLLAAMRTYPIGIMIARGKNFDLQIASINVR